MKTTQPTRPIKKPSKRASILATSVAALFSLCVVPSRARAQTPSGPDIWTGAASASWDFDRNWSLTAVPTSTNLASFPATIPGTGSTITLANPEFADSLAFANSYTLSGTTSGSSLTLTTGNVDVTPTFTATINAVLAGSAPLTLTDTGTLTLGAINTYSGATTVTAGTLSVASTGSIATSSTVAVGTAGTLNFAAGGTVFGNATLTGAATVTGSAGTIGGTLAVTGGTWNATSGTVSGLVTASANAFIIGAGANLTAVSGVNLTGGQLAGPGRLTGSLNDTSAQLSTFAGVIADGGTTSTLTVNNAATTLTLTGANTYTGATTVTAGTLSLTLTGSIAAGSTVNVGTAGILNFANGGNVFGNATLTGGATVTGSNGTIGGTLGVTGGNWNANLVTVTGLVTASGAANTFTIGAGAYLADIPGVSVTGGQIAGTGTLAASLNYTSAQSSTFGGAIADGAALSAPSNFKQFPLNPSTVTVNNAAATLTLTGTNFYTGATTVTAGTLSLTSTGSIAPGSTVNVGTAGTLNFAAGGTVFGNVTLTGGATVTGSGGTIGGTLGVAGGNWNATSGTVTGLVTTSGAANTFTIGTGATLTATAGVNVTDGQIAGPGTLKGSLSYYSAQTSAFAGVIANGANPSTLTVDNAAANLMLTGVNTYTGMTKVTSGTLSLGPTGSIAAGSTVGVDNKGTLNFLAGGTVFGNATLTGGAAVNGVGGTIGGTLGITGGNWNAATGTVTGLVTASGAANTFTIGGTGNLTALSGVNVTGGQIAGTGTLTGRLNYTSAQSSTFGGVIANFFASPSTLTVDNGATTLTLTGANTYTGDTKITSGTLSLGPTGSIAAGGTVGVDVAGILNFAAGGTVFGNATLTGGAIVTGSGGTIGGTLKVTGGNWNATSGTVTGLITAISDTSTFTIGSGANLTATAGINLVGGQIAGTGTLTGSLNDTSTQSSTFGGVIAGAGNSLTVNNAATTLTLTGTSTYTGATTVTAGTLQVGNGSGGNLTGTSGVMVANNATLVTNLLTGSTFAPAIFLNGANAVLNAIQSGTNTLSGVISGAGILNQTGAGTTILTNTETYTGATTVGGGTLQVGNGTGGNLTGTSGITVANNATLAVNLLTGSTFAPAIFLNGTNAAVNAIQTGTNTLSGLVSGAGILNQSGTGTTILTANETYTGKTTVNAGTLQIGNGTTSSINPSSAVQVNATGALAINLAGSSTFANAVSLNAASANLNAIQSGTTTLSGLISGAGVLNQNGAGLTILTGSNTYTGGTNVNAGTLQIGTGTIGSISSSGAVQVNGAGALTVNLASGSTFANAVSLNAASANLNAIQSGTNTFSGVISGAGALNQNGSGVTILTGSNTYTGVTNVNAGALYVDGSTASANTIIQPGAILGGHGVIGGALNNGGVVSPGNSPGTLTVNGNYTQASTGTLLIEIGGLAPSQHDLLKVGGVATLGGTLQLEPLNGFHFTAPGQGVTFLTATGGVSGKFSVVENLSSFQPSLLIDESLVYTSNGLAIESSQGSIFGELSGIPRLTTNDLSVARALDSAIGDPRAAKIFALLNTDNLGQLIRDIQLINPDELTSLSNIGASIARIHTLNVENRLDALQGGATGFSGTGFNLTDNSAGYAGPTGPDGKGGKEVAPPPADYRWGSFITGAGEFDRVGDTSVGRGFNLDSGGLTLGVDYRFTDHFVVGLFGGYTNTGIDIAEGGRINVNGGKIGLYSTYFNGGFYANAAVQGGYSGYDIHRTALGGTALSSPDGGDLNVLFATGYNWTAHGLTFGPTARFQYSYQSVDGFTETGSLAPMSVGSQHTESIVSAFGIKASYDWKIGSTIIRPELRLEWEHEYGDTATGIAAQLASGAGSSFGLTSPAVGRDSLHLGAGVAAVLSPRLTAYVYYDGEFFRTNYDSSLVTGGFRVSF